MNLEKINFVELEFFVSKTQIKRVLNKSRNEVPYNEFIYFVFKILNSTWLLNTEHFIKHLLFFTEFIRK